MLLVLAHTAFRAWAMFGAWFQEDDFEFLRDSRANGLTLDYVMEPHTGHLMPLGRLLADLSMAGGLFNWPATAAVTAMLQGVVGLAAFWMLRTLFGMRWGIVPPLMIFLFSAITMPASVWWAVALNQIPQQIGLLCAVACWVLAERTGRTRWVLLTLAAVVFALAADIRGLMIPPVLAAISFGWFETGSAKQRLVSLVRRRWLIIIVAGAVGLGTIAYYALYIEQNRLDTDWGLLGPLTDTMLGTGFATGITGGPWDWYSPTPPAAFADPPEWATRLSWLVIAGVVTHAFLTRRRTGRAWALLLFGLVTLLLLLWSSRAPFVGDIAGTEYRYLTEAAALAMLALGLAYLEVDGAAGSSVPRESPMFTPRFPVQVPIAITTAIAMSGLWSATQFALVWHGFTDPRDYVSRLSKEFATTGPLALADAGLPPTVVGPNLWSEQRVPRLVGLLSPDSVFPEASHDLAVIDDSGALTHAALEVATSSEPGPVDGCGWRIPEGEKTIPLVRPTVDFDWWLRISYLAPKETPVVIEVEDGDAVRTTLRAGLHQLFVRADGQFDSVDLTSIDPSLIVCVDKIDVGTISPGAPLT
ncbi:hypothetical protein [Nocardioides piscis]|uniref:Glycosyltransferase family 39 protein n=1 Tax=Nocardioides piscis TaxID=2714938 RepID=A0A6G7YHK1_9ACTN|nr:hypothetical protein [Nocardioides piscis]QIK76295.1 hypothetical protein G7071_13545 [Nocardioides piscis]